MSDREITRRLKSFAQSRLEKEYGFAPAANKVVIMEAGYNEITGYVDGVSVTVSGKYYSITRESVLRMPEYDIERWTL